MAHPSTSCWAGPCEPLEKHLSEVARCVAQKGEAVANKLARVFGVGLEVALDVLEFMALAHDVGKAAVPSQDQRHFPKHEAYSMVFIYDVALKALRGSNAPACDMGSGGSKKGLAGLLTAALWAVALHHYYKSYDKGDSVAFNPHCQSYRLAIEEWTPRSDVGRMLRDAALKLSSTRASNCYKRLIESIGKERGKLVYAASALLGLLGECDNEVAGRNRCDNGEGGGR